MKHVNRPGHNPAPEIRCGHCGRLLAKGRALSLAIKCPRCGLINKIKAESPEPRPEPR